MKFRSKNEELVYEYLKELFPNTPIHHDYQIGNGLSVDFLVKSTLAVAVEVDGEQHYRFVARFHKDFGDWNNQRKRDVKKSEICRKSGFVLVRVDGRNRIEKEDFFRTVSAHIAGHVMSALSEIQQGYYEDFKKKEKEKRREYYKKSYQRYKEWKKQRRNENRRREA